MTSANLDLNYCESLQTVDGLSNLPNLASLNLNFCGSLRNIDIVANLPNLSNLNLSFLYINHTNAAGEDIFTTRAEVAAYQEEIRKSMK